MDYSDIFALVSLSISALVFIVLASRVKGSQLTLYGYTLADQEVDSSKYGASFVAASTSLATVILFFLGTAKVYGLTLFWCGLTYAAGQYVFVKFLRKHNTMSSDTKTLSDLWYTTVKSKVVSRWITTVTVSSFIIILFVELYIGSIIFGYFLSSITAYHRIAAFLLTGLVVVYYVKIGGLKAVIQTDGWQLILLLTAVGALFTFSIIASPSDEFYEFKAISLLKFDANWQSIGIFWFWILCLNFTLPFTQLSSWQRVVACKIPMNAWKGFWKYLYKFLIVWTVPVLAFVILSSKGINYESLPQLIQSLKQNGGLSEGLLYPLIIVGFGSALFSTADTALIALTTSFTDQNTFKTRLENLEPGKLSNRITFFSITVMVLLTVVFGVAEADVGTWFMPLVYNIFGQLAILAPLMFYALYRMDKNPISVSLSGNVIISLGIVLAWAIILYSTFITNKTGDQIWSQMATPAGMLVSFLFLRLGLIFKKKSK